MKKKLPILGLVVIIISLLNTSCTHTGRVRVVIRVARPVTAEELTKMPPFEATIESIDISHFLFDTYVDIWLRRTDGGSRLDLQLYPANKFSLDFVHTLREGHRYSFPQVFADYINSQPTNAVVK